MTQLLERSPENTLAAPGQYRDICFRDSVRLHFLFRAAGAPEWHDANYSIDAEVVAGPEGSNEDSPFVPYLLPDRPLPEGDQYATQHPFRMNESMFSQETEDGRLIELRYVVVQRDEAESLQSLLNGA